MKDRTHIKNRVPLSLWWTEPTSKSCSVLMKDRTHIKNRVLLSLWRTEPISKIVFCPYEGQNPHQKSCSVVLMMDRTHIKIVFCCPYEGQNPYQKSWQVCIQSVISLGLLRNYESYRAKVATKLSQINQKTWIFWTLQGCRRVLPLSLCLLLLLQSWITKQERTTILMDLP